MHKRVLNLLLCGAMLGAAWAPPAQAAPTITSGDLCAMLEDNTGTAIGITDLGTVPIVVCHDTDTLCDEAFSACVGSSFAVGAEGYSGFNLKPSTSSCQPFYIPGPGAAPIFIQPEGGSGIVYNLDDINGDGSNVSAPLGVLVQVVMENRPTSGSCLGVRTTIQHRKGTCKIWKIRKFFNTCSTNQTITQIREFELPCAAGTFAAKAGPGGIRTAVASDVLDRSITLAAGGNLGARPSAGSIDADTFLGSELLGCGSTALTPAPRFGDQDRLLEVSLSFTPGGVTLKPAGKAGSEKFVDFHIDVE